MIDNLITIALGILVTLMGFGKILISKDAAKNQEYLNKYGTLLRVGGIFVIVLGIVLACVR